MSNLGPNVKLVTSDSVELIQSLAKQKHATFDLIYFDSWDVDWANPIPSAEQGLKEWNAIHPLLKSESIVVIDDTPAQNVIRGLNYDDPFAKKSGILPGKYGFVELVLDWILKLYIIISIW